MRMRRKCVAKTFTDPDTMTDHTFGGCGVVQYTSLGEFNSLPDGWRDQPCTKCGTHTLDMGVLEPPVVYKGAAGLPDRCLCKVLKDKRYICTYHMLKMTGADPDTAADEFLTKHEIVSKMNPQLDYDTTHDERKDALTHLPKARLVPFGLMNNDSLEIDTEHMMSEVLPSKRHWSRIPWRTSEGRTAVQPNVQVTTRDGAVRETGPRGGESRSQQYARGIRQNIMKKLEEEANRLLDQKQERMNPQSLGARVNLSGGKQS